MDAYTSAVGNPDELKKFLAEAGYEAEDAVLEKMFNVGEEDGELTEDDLEAVSGGGTGSFLKAGLKVAATLISKSGVGGPIRAPSLKSSSVRFVRLPIRGRTDISSYQADQGMFAVCRAAEQIKNHQFEVLIQRKGKEPWKQSKQ